MKRESVWPSGRAVCWQALRRTAVRYRFSSPFSSKGLWFVDSFVALYITVNETLKWLSSLPILMQESFWWWQCSDRYIISPFLPSPFLISLVVSVDTCLPARSWRSCLCRSRDSLSSGRSTVQQYCVQFSPVPSKQSQKPT